MLWKWNVKFVELSKLELFTSEVWLFVILFTSDSRWCAVCKHHRKAVCRNTSPYPRLTHLTKFYVVTVSHCFSFNRFWRCSFFDQLMLYGLTLMVNYVTLIWGLPGALVTWPTFAHNFSVPVGLPKWLETLRYWCRTGNPSINLCYTT